MLRQGFKGLKLVANRGGQAFRKSWFPVTGKQISDVTGCLGS